MNSLNICQVDSQRRKFVNGLWINNNNNNSNFDSNDKHNRNYHSSETNSHLHNGHSDRRQKEGGGCVGGGRHKVRDANKDVLLKVSEKKKKIEKEEMKKSYLFFDYF